MRTETSLVRGWPDWLLLTGLIGLVLTLKAWLIHAQGLELHFDEAQYWEWSRQLDWSYYSKGPLIAWLIALSEWCFGHGEWQVRLFAWLAHGIFLALLFALTRSVWNSRRAAWWVVLIAMTTPLYFTLGMVMTTDGFLFVFWTWGLWALYRALFQGQRWAWYEGGAAVGIGALTKLSIGLLPFFSGLLLLGVPRWRRHLGNPHLWGALVLMLLCMSPMVLWNAGHDWVMFRHELGHVKHDAWSLARTASFILGQWGVLSPLLVMLAAAVLWRLPAAQGQRFLWWISLGSILFFIVKAGSAKVQLNWPSPSYIGLLVLFAGHIPRLPKAGKYLLHGGILSSVVLLCVAFFPQTFGLHGRQDPFKVTKQWRRSITALSEKAPGVDFILARTYPLAAELAFYWPRRIPVYITGDPHRRFNQHDLWPGIEREAGRDGIYVSDYPQQPAALARAFARCTRLKPIEARAADGMVLRTLYASRCEEYRPITWPTPGYY